MFWLCRNSGSVDCMLGLYLQAIELCCATRYNIMIKEIKHKGLRQFFEEGKLTGIQAVHAKRLRLQLIALHTAQEIEDLNLPGYRLHRLQGARKKCWSITVNRNWRLTFEFIAGDVYLLNYEDYH